MRRWIAMLALCLSGVAGAAFAAGLDGPRLTVTGEGRVDSVPDLATITLGVTNEAKTARAAMDATSVAVAAILESLAQDGIEPRDTQTRDLSLQPVWHHSPSSSNQPPRITGFQASNTVIVRVRDLDALGGILDRVIDSGANNFQGLSFGLQDPEPVADAARRAAVSDARRKADLYAEAAGIALGRLLQLDEVGGRSGPMPVMAARMEMSGDVPVAQGEVTTSSSVNMVFEILAN